MFAKMRDANPENYPANFGKPWSEEEKIKLLEGVRSKKSHDELAEIHERTAGSIRGMLKNIAVDYYNNNKLPVEQIQKFTGLSLDVIQDAINRHDAKTNTKTSEKSESRKSSSTSIEARLESLEKSIGRLLILVEMLVSNQLK